MRSARGGWLSELQKSTSPNLLILPKIEMAGSSHQKLSPPLNHLDECFQEQRKRQKLRTPFHF